MRSLPPAGAAVAAGVRDLPVIGKDAAALAKRVFAPVVSQAAEFFGANELTPLQVGVFAYYVTVASCQPLLVRWSETSSTANEMGGSSGGSGGSAGGRTTLEYNTASAVLCIEGVKLAVSYASEARLAQQKRRVGKAGAAVAKAPGQISWAQWSAYGVPSALYAVLNNLGFYAIYGLGPHYFALFSTAKVLCAAVASRLILEKQLNQVQWAALVLLACALCVAKLGSTNPMPQSSSIDNTIDGAAADEQSRRFAFGFFCVCLTSVLSGLSGVINEYLLKRYEQPDEDQQAPSLMRKNLWMYQWGCLLNFLACFVQLSSEKGMFHGFNFVVWFLIVVKAAEGLGASFILSFFDNIVKGYASSLQVLVVTVGNWLFFGSGIDGSFVVAVVIFCCSSFLYSGRHNELLGVVGTPANNSGSFSYAPVRTSEQRDTTTSSLVGNAQSSASASAMGGSGTTGPSLVELRDIETGPVSPKVASSAANFGFVGGAVASSSSSTSQPAGATIGQSAAVAAGSKSQSNSKSSGSEQLHTAGRNANLSDSAGDVGQSTNSKNGGVDLSELMSSRQPASSSDKGNGSKNSNSALSTTPEGKDEAALHQAYLAHHAADDIADLDLADPGGAVGSVPSKSDAALFEEFFGGADLPEQTPSFEPSFGASLSGDGRPEEDAPWRNRSYSASYGQNVDEDGEGATEDDYPGGYLNQNSPGLREAEDEGVTLPLE